MSSTYHIAVLPGDGIGPEVMEVALRLLNKVASQEGFQLTTTEGDVGGIAIDRHGKALPDSTLELCRRSDAILFGSVGGPQWENLPPAEQPERASLLPLRKAFALFANLRPGIIFPELTEASPLKPSLVDKGLDILCVRELTGGVYFGQPKTTRTLEDGDVESIDTMVYRRSEIERIGRVAIEAARLRGKSVTSVDKANVLETSVLWRKTMVELFQREAPDLELKHLYVDNAAMQLVKSPSQFDVMVTENMFGDILSDEMAVICGSLGTLASASLGTENNRLGKPFGLYEPAGGTAPDIAGKNLANPCAQVLSAALMLRYSFGEEKAAQRLEDAVRRTVADGFRTADIAFGGPSCSTTEMEKALSDHL